jgi:hypothetical protein
MGTDTAKTIPITSDVPLPTNNGSPPFKPFIFKRGSEYTPKPIDWLWKNYLARRKITLLAGESGTAKSTMSLSWAATISTGGMWPDNTGPASLGITLVYSCEDDNEDTHLPRYMAHDGNRDNIIFLEGRRDFLGNSIPFDPTTDFKLLLEYVTKLGGGIDLLIIDPIITIVKGDANQNNKVRQALQVISDLAKQLNCAVVAIIHFAKNTQGRKVLDRILHSGAFVQVSRVVLNTVQVRNTEEYWLVRSKVSNGVAGGGMSYFIEPTFVDNNTLETTRIHWNGILKGNADELISKAEGTFRDDTTTKVGRARALLLEMLLDGPRLKEDIDKEAATRDISENALQNAKTELNVVDFKIGFQGPTWWKLSLKRE